MPATQGSLEVLRERLEALRDELADVEQQVGGMRVGETPVSEVNRIEARLPELRRRVHALEATLARESH